MRVFEYGSISDEVISTQDNVRVFSDLSTKSHCLHQQMDLVQGISN